MSIDHPDERVREALRKLHAELSRYERSAGREVMVVVIPVEKTEPVLVSVGGIPLRMGWPTDGVVDLIKDALEKHNNPAIHHFSG